MSANIVFLSLAERPECADLLLQSMEKNSDWHEILPWLRECISVCDKKPLPHITLAFDGPQLIGFFIIAEEELLIEKPRYFPWLGILMVFDNYRGLGYSPLMIEEACAEAKHMGFKNIYLATEHIQYYERYGFQRIGLSAYQWGAPTKIYKRDLSD